MSVEQEGNPIKQFRTARGWSQQDLADAMGIAKSTLSRMEKAGTNPTMETLLRAVDAMGGRLLMIAQFDDGQTSKFIPSAG